MGLVLTCMQFESDEEYDYIFAVVVPSLSCIYNSICYRARKIKPLGSKKTLDGIWFLILIIYVYTFDTCLNFLRCVGTDIHTDDFNTTKSGPLVSYTMYLVCLLRCHLYCRFISMMEMSSVFRTSIFHML